MDQDKTWHGNRPRSRPHCVGWRLTSPPQKGHSPLFLALVCCGQTAGWIKMSLGMQTGLGLGDIVLDGDRPTQHPSPKGHSPQFSARVCMLWPNGWVDEDATWYGGRPRPRRHCVRWGPISPRKGHSKPPVFALCLLWSNGRPSQLLLSTYTNGRPKIMPAHNGQISRSCSNKDIVRSIRERKNARGISATRREGVRRIRNARISLEMRETWQDCCPVCLSVCCL